MHRIVGYDHLGLPIRTPVNYKSLGRLNGYKEWMCTAILTEKDLVEEIPGFHGAGIYNFDYKQYIVKKHPRRPKPKDFDPNKCHPSLLDYYGPIYFVKNYMVGRIKPTVELVFKDRVPNTYKGMKIVPTKVRLQVEMNSSPYKRVTLHLDDE